MRGFIVLGHARWSHAFVKIHYFQHVEYEDLGSIADWAKQRHHPVSATRWHCGDTPPHLDEVDLLIIMGGPMNIYEDNLYPWLAAEKRFIAAAIAAGKRVLGVCLGAQLIADVMGAKVTANAFKEIGWFPVHKSTGANGPFAAALPESFTAFHWHGDTFNLPPGATRLAHSVACENQAFSVDDQILGLQFHLEVAPINVQTWAEQGSHELVEAPYIQSPGAMLADPEQFKQLNQLMQKLLDQFDA